jgi:hypothetical protein
MKTKLLKKIRKRYEWYFNNDGFPVLIDHYKKIVTLYDVEYCTTRLGYKVDDLPTIVKVPLQEWAIRILKIDILGQYGWNINNVRYKIAVSRLKQKQKNNSK